MSGPVTRERGRGSSSWRLAYTLQSLLAAIVGLIFLLPLWWTLAGSLRSSSSIFQYLNPLQLRTFLPVPVAPGNYGALLHGDLGLAMLNSLFVAAATVVAGLIICSSAAFALSAIQFRGRGLVFVVVLVSFLVPFEAIAIPLANIFRDWHLQNTYPGLVLPGLGNGMAIFLLRTFFMAVPVELAEAARVDGLGWWGIFTRIYLPLSRPALIGAGLTLFLFQWQSYVWPLLIGTDSQHTLAPIALAALEGQHSVDYGALFAGSIILTLIPLVMILAFQRHFVQSAATSGLK